MRSQPKVLKRDPFDSSHLEADLRGHTVRGGMATFGAQGVGFLINLISTALLARLLSPADFGLVAMVTALTGIAGMLKDSGLSAATIQVHTVTHEQVSTLFWLNVLLSVGLALCIAASGPVIAWAYGQPKLQPIAGAIAATFVFDGLAIQHQALLRRQMRFSVLARIQILSAVLAFVVAAASALRGLGYWSLILQAATQQLAGTLLTWGHCRWVPGRPQRNTGVRRMLAFGGYLTGFNFLNYFARNADNVLIGHVWGSGALGLYSKAYGLLTLPLQQINGPISAVAIPALSRLQKDEEKFRELFGQVLGVMSFLVFPLVAWVLVFRNELIRVFLGPQWVEAAPMLAVFALSAFIQPIGNITGVLYMALGRTRRMLAWGLVGCPWLVASFFVGIRYGAFGVAAAYTVATALMIVPLVAFAIAGTCVRWRDFVVAMRYQAGAASVAAALGLGAKVAFGQGGSLWLTLVFPSVLMMSAYLGIFLIKKREQLMAVVSFAKARRTPGLSENSEGEREVCSTGTQ